jgi:tetratricopeptide (TPR) repeat protein
MPKVTISYRRADTEAVTGRIFDRLAGRYGRESVFRDIDNIPPGIDFRRHIAGALRESNVLIVMIGQKWLGSRSGQFRIMAETDPVRIEVETATKQGLPIIPVLVGSTKMPQPADLPESLKDFAYLNAIRLDTGQDFDHHAGRIIRAIDQILDRDGIVVPDTQDAHIAAARKHTAAAQPERSPAPRSPERPTLSRGATDDSDSDLARQPRPSAPIMPASPESALNPLCLVLMPFGRKYDQAGRLIDFDKVFSTIAAPAVAQAGMEAIRADGARLGGMIDKATIERIIHCNYILADISGIDPNIYYGLGLRHALRPNGTAVMFAERSAVPFDIALLRGHPYKVDMAGVPEQPNWDIAMIAGRLRDLRSSPHDDSPLYQLFDSLPQMEIDHSKAETFRDRVGYQSAFQQRLSEARKAGPEAVKQLALELHDLREVDVGVVIDCFLSLRDVKAYQEMVNFYGLMPYTLKQARMISEQLAFALTRLGNREQAEKVLKQVIDEFGPSNETNALLARTYKDRWDAATRAGNDFQAKIFLKQAIDSYVEAFEADLRDPYSGINAVTLMELLDEVDPRQADLIPAVYYATRRRARAGGDYWDQATVLELAVLGRNRIGAEEAIGLAIAAAAVAWEIETTIRNISSVRKQRQARGEDVGWIVGIEDKLDAKQQALVAAQPQA